PLTSVCFVLKGRLKVVRVDAQGAEHFFRMLERGEQFGILLGVLGETLPVRIFALEPTTILSLDYERAMELTFKYPDLRRHWIQSCARGFRRHFFDTAADRATSLLAVLHESPATRGLTHKLVRRLRELGEEICVLSDSD